MTLLIYKSELSSLLDAIKMYENYDIKFTVEIHDKKSKLKDYMLKITFEEDCAVACGAIYKAGRMQAEKELKRENI